MNYPCQEFLSRIQEIIDIMYNHVQNKRKQLNNNKTKKLWHFIQNRK